MGRSFEFRKARKMNRWSAKSYHLHKIEHIITDLLDVNIWTSIGIEIDNNAPIEKAFNLGIFQV